MDVLDFSFGGLGRIEEATEGGSEGGVSWAMDEFAKRTGTLLVVAHRLGGAFVRESPSRHGTAAGGIERVH